MLNVIMEASLRATLIAAAALLALTLLRVRTAAVRHRAWSIVLIAMLALPIWVAMAPEIAWHILPPAGPSAAATSSDASASTASSDASASNAVAPPLALGGPARDAAISMAPGTEEAAAARSGGSTSAPPGERSHWRAWLLALYLAGAGALLARLAIGTARVHRLAREARVVKGRLTSGRIATPFTVGALNAKILLPEGWDRWPASRIAAVLEHERAHVRRRDPLVQWLALLNRALFWFHPLAWSLERRLAALAEEACDAAVLSRGCAAEAYSEHLLDLARMARRGPRMPLAVGAPMPGSALPERIAKILEGNATRPGSRAAAAGSAAFATLAAVAIGSVTLAQEPRPTPLVPPADEPGSTPLVPPADSFTPLPENWFADDEWHLEVAPIMSPEEAEAYRSLRSTEERDRFIGAFWLRRDPTPGTFHNERKKEYERRIHYADRAFRDASGPGEFGYRTTRGAVYVLLGEPDSIERAVEGDGESYEYWRYSDVNGTGLPFTVRLALSPRFGCGPAYEIVEPAPTRIYQGGAWLGGNSMSPLTVRVYPLGLVTVSIPFEYGTVRHIRTTLASPSRAVPVDRLFGFEFTLAQKGLPAAKRSITVAGQEGLNCTLPLSPGQYDLAAEVDLFSGDRLTASVIFDVDTP